MELREFVSDTLKQIIDGVASASIYAAEKGATVNPRLGRPVEGFATLSEGSVLQKVDFDVAVTTSEGATTTGGVGVFVGPVALGSKGQSNERDASFSRIKFFVVVKLPSGSRQTG